MILFKNAVLLDCTGKDPIPSAWVVVEGEIIKDVGSGKPPALSGAETIDCKGKTLMPGLIEGHMHICFFDNDMTAHHRKYLPTMATLRAAELLKDTLYQGFTTARDCGAADAGYRDAQKMGLVIGPRLQVAGRTISMTGGHTDARLSTEIAEPLEASMFGSIADGVSEVRKAVREQIRLGVDWIKVMAGGGCASEADNPDTVQYSPDELSALVYEAEAAGKKTMAHAYTCRSIRNAVEAGITSIEHGNYLDEDTAKLIKKHDCWLVPTMATYEIMATRGEEFGIPGYFLRKMKEVREQSENALSIAYKEGVKIGSGADMIGSGQPYKALEIELKARVMGAMDAILCTTKNNAELMGISEYVGTIEPGKLADMIIVDEDPLKNIRVFQQRDKILAIIQGGEFFKNIL